MKANQSKAARPRQWGTVTTMADLGPPAHMQGLTILGASAAYGQSVHAMRLTYILGRDECSAPIGRRDAWGVWFADPLALKGVLGPGRVVAAAQTRTASRAADLRARMSANVNNGSPSNAR